jgi:hypothetical protein
MDVPLVLNNIGIRYTVKRYKRKSSTFSHTTVVDGFFAFLLNPDDRNGAIDVLLLINKFTL